MTTGRRDQAVETTPVGNGTTDRHPMERHLFQTIEHIGRQPNGSEWKRRAAAMALAILICVVVYGLSYLAMHVH